MSLISSSGLVLVLGLAKLSMRTLLRLFRLEALCLFIVQLDILVKKREGRLYQTILKTENRLLSMNPY